VCLFVENADFNKRSERMLSELFRSGARAAAQVHDVNQALDAHGVALADVQGQLEGVADSQAVLLKGVAAGRRAVEDVRAAAGELGAGMERSLAAQAALQGGQSALAAGLSGLHADAQAHAAAAVDAWQVEGVGKGSSFAPL